jgi:hypothetical protein
MEINFKASSMDLYTNFHKLIELREPQNWMKKIFV